MENINVPDLVARLGSEEDSVRKMAAFKLQSVIGDPSFADVFIAEGGLPRLRALVLRATGNTLAYSLTSLSRLLELDQGWEFIDEDVIERVVELVVTHPLVNILRGAMSILAAIVSHPPPASSYSPAPASYGFRALKPALAIYPQFLEMLVSRLSSADHALCANALQLINSLVRDSITNSPEPEWPKFIKRLQDLGVIKAVYGLMRGTAIHDLAGPLLEFQALTKVLLKKWRDVRVDVEKPEHRRALKGLHAASKPEKTPPERLHTATTEESRETERETEKGSRRHNSEKWRRLGFETENPASEFEDAGFLGLMDLTDWVRKNKDGFQKFLLEQANMPPEKRCPLARVSLSVTTILYDHFEIANSSADFSLQYAAVEPRANFDAIYKPPLLQWSRLHSSSLQAFLRLWKATGAESEDFQKVEDLVRILVEQVVGQAARTTDVEDVEKELREFEYQRLRDLQMQLLKMGYEDAWGHHLRQVREELHHEALQFVKEQRIRCLLAGSWFPHSSPISPSPSPYPGGPVTAQNLSPTPRPTTSSFRFVKLSHNRRYLHYADFPAKLEVDPGLDTLPEKIDLSIVSSVVSNVSATVSDNPDEGTTTLAVKTGVVALDKQQQHQRQQQPTTKITIHGYLPPPSGQGQKKDGKAGMPGRTLSERRRGLGGARGEGAQTPLTLNPNPYFRDGDGKREQQQQQQEEKEQVLLTLCPDTHILASEWLDGLLMLLQQAPITAETGKLVDMIEDCGVKIRLLNVRLEDLLEEESSDAEDEDEEDDIEGEADDGNGARGMEGEQQAKVKGKGREEMLNGNANAAVKGRTRRRRRERRGEVPTTEGLDEDYYYDIGGM